MPDFRTIQVDGHDVVLKILRPHNSKSVKLHVNTDGQIVVSAPKRAPLFIIKQAIAKNSDWLISQLDAKPFTPTSLVKPGARIGRNHHLHFRFEQKLKKPLIAITESQTTIRLPIDIPWEASEAQQIARSAILKTLRSEASSYLPARLEQLATLHDFSYNSVKIRKLERRWGSCSSKADITFNFRLMSHPYEVIDYVIIHELCHTIYPHHQKQFWSKVASILPNYKELRRELNK